MAAFEGITWEQIEAFSRDGVVVIDNVLSPEEVDEAREGYHAYLKGAGVDHDDLGVTGKNLAFLSSTGGAGGILDIYYASFKLKVAENPNIVKSVCALWEFTYAKSSERVDSRCKDSGNSVGEGATNDGVWNHPHGTFDPRRPLMAVDRVCYRLPDVLSLHLGRQKDRLKERPLQRHLAPHLDCCPPHESVEIRGKGIEMWRPIQGFVALTDCLEPNCGGFECCYGFHREFLQWAEKRRWSTKKGRNGQDQVIPPPCLGNFSPIRPIEDADVIRRFQHVPCKAGSLVLWDNRIPHANSKVHEGNSPREVLYVSLLPKVKQNMNYVEDQLVRFKEGSLPSDFWQAAAADDIRQHAQDHEFTTLGKQMMGIKEYQ